MNPNLAELYYHRENVTEADAVSLVGTDLSTVFTDRRDPLGYKPNQLLPVNGRNPLLVRVHGVRTAGSAESETLTLQVVGWPPRTPGSQRRISGIPRGIKLYNGVVTFGPETAGTLINPITGQADADADDPLGGDSHEADDMTIVYPTTPASELLRFAAIIGDTTSTRASLLVNPLGCTNIFCFINGFSGNLNRVDISVQQLPGMAGL